MMGTNLDITEKKDMENHHPIGSSDIIVPSTLPEGLRYAVANFGLAILSSKTLVNILNDFQLFRDTPALKRTIINMQEEGYIHNLCKCASWELETASLSDKYIKEFATKENLVHFVFDSIGFALNKVIDLPIYDEINNIYHRSLSPNTDSKPAPTPSPIECLVSNICDNINTSKKAQSTKSLPEELSFEDAIYCPLGIKLECMTLKRLENEFNLLKWKYKITKSGDTVFIESCNCTNTILGYKISKIHFGINEDIMRVTYYFYLKANEVDNFVNDLNKKFTENNIQLEKTVEKTGANHYSKNIPPRIFSIVFSRPSDDLPFVSLDSSYIPLLDFDFLK